MADLQQSIEFVLRSGGVRAKVRKIGGSVVVEVPDPVGTSALLENMPGVAWVAAGLAVGSFKELGPASGALARKYLRRGDRFAVGAEGTLGTVGSDVSGAVTSGVLDSVKGARVSQEAPRAKFRAAFDGSKGVVGVELKRGPGGVPTGRESASCLVSGGLHSSVVAWMAVLMGFRVRLVHAKCNEEALRAAARLYSELSHRADPRGLVLEVLEGGSEAGALAEFVKSEGPVFGGFHSTSGAVPRVLGSAVLAPLYLMPEEMYRSEFESLQVKGHDSMTDWRAARGGRVSARTFGGVAADVSGVLDGLH